MAALFTISVEKELFYVKFYAKLNDPFWKYQVLIQLQYNNVCKIHLDEPNGPKSIEIRIVLRKKFTRVSSIFQNVQFFLSGYSWKLNSFVSWFHIIISIQVLVLQGSLTKNMVAWLRYLWHVSVAKVSFRDFFFVYNIFFTNFDLDHNFPCLNLSKNLLFSFAVQWKWMVSADL